MFVLKFFVFVIAVTADPALDQLVEFKKKTNGPIGTLTLTNGCPVEIRDTIAVNSNLLRNQFFMDSINGFVREKIPERVVHAKGAGAFGYFEVTHDITDICKAKLFNKVGKKTPVAVRFSHSSLDKGEPDSNIDGKGFAIKFYSEDGNFDILGFNTPMFMTKDPIMFEEIMRTTKRNPVTNLLDRTMVWDLMTLSPELVFFFMYIFSDNAIPISYKNMPGYSIHTYQVANEIGQSYFVRFQILPEDGFKNYSLEEAMKMGASNPDYLAQDLYNLISKGEYPTWIVSVQVLSLEDVKSANFDVFDVTKVLPLDKYPLRPVGKLILNRNPTNYFADVEQIAFCPASLVPGILGAPDKMFEARLIAYREAHAYRLGSNSNKIKVNCPFSNTLTFNRDGRIPVGDNGNDAPNYVTNSFNGAVPYIEANKPALISLVQDLNQYDFSQPSEWFENMPSDERNRLVSNIVTTSLSKVNEDLRKRGVRLFKAVHPELGRLIQLALDGFPLN